MAEKTWFITGASRGLGRVWTEAALARGDKVAACARKRETLSDLVEAYGSALLPIELDVRSEEEVRQAVRVAAAAWGRLDVVVGNAGYAVFGTIEETDGDSARAQFDTNFFGTLWVVQAVLPYLRKQGGGHILITSSLAGIITFPTAGIYNATKWAVEGLGETLAAEVAAFGIKVTLIEPGGYDTDWRGSSSVHLTQMADYDGLRDRLKAAPSRKLGNPAATGEAILRVVDAPTPPLRLFLGEVPLEVARKQYAERLATWEAWADVSRRAQG
ncbi:SDR family NAD(P)-dependent oxidoreductase [Labrys wisconsinensis]|uniref:NAD(P)-dependent dehydrogenase (Short-subunit alcohol dehydrogenase family) n=1 Tax=Labrys wisconsinensis TaxID=425677 RepID=A0ABU0J5C3_9HYPH|nr:SDR family NAD(P)-dependent oxidoreductase [Labrys wisconsinensis]MDQ0469461.1 NAD(P)-dependent dehydrogenase (short-subunit alcohol dehydrogenase family) [Labrys wisconsinensis]